MSETAVILIEISAIIIALGISIHVALQLRENAKKHEQQAEKLDKQVRRAINI